MSSSRDIRAMIASLEKSMQQIRSCRGPEVDVERRRKARSDLEEDVIDATGVLRMAKRSGVDSSRLAEKVEAARKLMEKEDSAAGTAAAGNDSVAPNTPVSREPRHPASPTQTTFVKQTAQSRRDDDAGSIRSSVAARNADELRRREEEIRRRDEDVKLRQRMDAIDLESKQRREAFELESKQRREALELESARKREAIELEALKVKHQREEDDAEEEDERRSLFIYMLFL